MSIRRRPLRQVATLVLSGSLIAASFATTALAQTANVGVGGGVVIDNTSNSGATPTQVSPGKTAGFYLWIHNNDSANLSTFFMNAVTDSTPVGAYWWRNAETTTHSCTTTDGLRCDFGALNSGDVIRIVAAFTAVSSTKNCLPDTLPANSGGVTPAAGTHACVDFQFGSQSGYVPGKKKDNQSRGDAYHWYDVVGTNTTADQGATFPFCDPASTTCSDAFLSVFNTTGATRNNVQSTKVTAPNLDEVFNSAYGTTGLAVADNLGADVTCEDFGNLSSCTEHEATGGGGFLGQWSAVDVNSETLYGDAFIRVDISMYGVNPNSIDGVEHVWSLDGGTTWLDAQITAKCPTSAGPATEQTTECFWASGNGNVANVSVWLHNNGKLRNF
jgi:hypothetical protein